MHDPSLKNFWTRGATPRRLHHFKKELMNVLEGLKQELQMRIDSNQDIAMVPEIIAHIEKLEKEIKNLYHHSQEAINTTYRFVASYKKENNADTQLCLNSCEYHLSRLAELVYDEDGIGK